MISFKELNLSESLLKAIHDVGITEPTEIQEKTIPLVLAGKDVIAQSATGSGKTLAFGAGIIQNIKRGQGIQALVLTPTRELAEQVAQALRTFSEYSTVGIKEVYGGVGMSAQIESFSKVEIIVGTPGRILDHLKRGNLNLSKINFLVLDEADRMVDMGFIQDMKEIIRRCPEKRQTLLFSATMSTTIDHIARQYMVHPKYITVESFVEAAKLKQYFYDVPSNMKFSLLVYLLREEKGNLVMVFSNTRHNTDFIANNLKRLGFDVLAIHGGIEQKKRNLIMEKFHSGKEFVLICTDVAARGLDIKNVSHIYNYDLPKTDTDYIHRIGRTARAGTEGIAISLVSKMDYENFQRIYANDSLEIVSKKVPDIPMIHIFVDKNRHDRFNRGGRFRERDRDDNRPRSNFGQHRRDHSRYSRAVKRMPSHRR
ncbi:MAG: DEAD/DEAH box helicase [Candidatus Pacearchaeota archaeon]|jgi:ATP-dependent RNA helicase DeaD